MEAFLFIFEIGGFPAFGNDTEDDHGRQLVDELMERAIDADSLGLTVADVDESTVLFYGDGAPPMKALLGEVRRMFIAFHAQTRLYETRRLCGCAACRAMPALRLRFVAHRGTIRVRRRQVEGPGVDQAFRILNVEIPATNALVLSEAFVESNFEPMPGWTFIEGQVRKTDTHPIRYRYTALESLHTAVPPLDPPTLFRPTGNPLAFEGTIDRPVDQLYELLSNLDHRLDWTDGIDDLIYAPERVNRVGMRHRCVVQGERLTFETVTADVGDGQIVYGERAEGAPLVDTFVVLWMLDGDGGQTRARIELHVDTAAYPKRLMLPFYRLGVAGQLRATFGRLKRYAEQQ